MIRKLDTIEFFGIIKGRKADKYYEGGIGYEQYRNGRKRGAISRIAAACCWLSCIATFVKPAYASTAATFALIPILLIPDTSFVIFCLLFYF
jgi:hypothetical protein